MKYKAVLFDMDGTLLDTLQDLSDSVNALLLGHGYPERPVDYVRRSVGNGVRALLKRALPHPATEEELDGLMEEYTAIYKKNLKNTTKPFPGVMDALAALKKDGVKTAIISNKPDYAVVPLSNDIFGSLIDIAMGEREGIPRKPDPKCINIALDALGVTAAEALYVGDSGVDIQTAKNSGLGSVGVTWGFRGENELRAEGAAHIINEIGEIIPLVAGR
jgi:phosphoglycolate phosphatase